MPAPTKSSDFDRAYRAPLTFWGDTRIPNQLKALARKGSPGSALELGCGVGRLSRYLVERGLRVTGVDFSSVAIVKARVRVADDLRRPDFRVGDGTHLDALVGPFDIGVDVGCFHCLDPEGQRKYVSEVSRLLAPDGTHLLWALDAAPSNVELSPATMKKIFSPAFDLEDARTSRRRLVRSHWYWLVRGRSTHAQ